MLFRFRNTFQIKSAHSLHLNSDSYFPIALKDTLNADRNNNGDGITVSDAIAIQKLIAGLINKFPVNMV